MSTNTLIKSVFLCATLIIGCSDDGQKTIDQGESDTSVESDASPDISRESDAGLQNDTSTKDASLNDVSSPPQDTLRAFPGAKGAGAVATGGRGGKVIHVTTLDWEGPGSLKEAITTKGPRIIVFDVSGQIDATSESDYIPIIEGAEFDNITIAGQSAPEGGITILTSEFAFFEVDNVIIRYVRFRSRVGSEREALGFQATSRVIFDHCTFSHGGTKLLQLQTPGPKRLLVKSLFKALLCKIRKQELFSEPVK